MIELRALIDEMEATVFLIATEQGRAWISRLRELDAKLDELSAVTPVGAPSEEWQRGFQRAVEVYGLGAALASTPQPDCAVCGGMGYILVPEQSETVTQREDYEPCPEGCPLPEPASTPTEQVDDSGGAQIQTSEGPDTKSESTTKAEYRR